MDGASFTRVGVGWLAHRLFNGVCGVSEAPGAFSSVLKKLAVEAGHILDSSPRLVGLDRTTESGINSVLAIAAEHALEPLMTAFELETWATRAGELIAEGGDKSEELARAAWLAGSANALLHFKQTFEEASYRGNAISQFEELLDEWRRNETNDSEDFWQERLFSKPFALAQLFASPIVVHGQRYLVGGMQAGGGHGKYVDLLLRNRITDYATIVEIKTPTAELLQKKQYRRDVFAPSSELAGAVQQVLEQRCQFMKDMSSLQCDNGPDTPRVQVVEPQAVVIAGNAHRELASVAQRRCFEMYRSELRNVRLVTYDELFERTRSLLELLRCTAEPPRGEGLPPLSPLKE